MCVSIYYAYSVLVLFLSGQSLVVGNNPANVGENVTIDCTTAVPSGITLRFDGNPVDPSTNPRVTIASQTATNTIYTFANVTKGDNGLNISCTIIATGNVLTTLGHTILVVQCEFCFSRFSRSTTVYT